MTSLVRLPAPAPQAAPLTPAQRLTIGNPPRGPLVVDRNGYVLRTPKNLGWLLAHADEIARFTVQSLRTVNDGRIVQGPEVLLIAHMDGLEPGTVYVTPFASITVLRAWLARPRFEGRRIIWRDDFS